MMGRIRTSQERRGIFKHLFVARHGTPGQAARTAGRGERGLGQQAARPGGPLRQWVAGHGLPGAGGGSAQMLSAGEAACRRFAAQQA